MKNSFIDDAFHILKGELAPEAGISLDLKEDDVLPMCNLLERYDLPALRQCRILSIYSAIKIALLRHSSTSCSGEELTRKVLDGDYLYSLYVQLCLKWEEYNLLSHLAPIIKVIQIKRADCKPEDDRLIKGFELFLQLELNRSTRSQAI